jgi:hypothetical protein
LPKDTDTLRQRRLDALMAAIAENPLPDHLMSDASRHLKDAQSAVMNVANHAAIAHTVYPESTVCHFSRHADGFAQRGVRVNGLADVHRVSLALAMTGMPRKRSLGKVEPLEFGNARYNRSATKSRPDTEGA